MNNIYSQIQSLKAEERKEPRAVALYITDTLAPWYPYTWLVNYNKVHFLIPCNICIDLGGQLTVAPSTQTTTGPLFTLGLSRAFQRTQTVILKPEPF
jgi:hypothetical protein